MSSPSLNITVRPDPAQSGALAAQHGATAIRKALRTKGHANLIVATGASQFEMLEALRQEEGIAWHKVTIFHLDEYVGLPLDHPASFRKYLWERFVSKLPAPPAAFHLLNGDDDPTAECQRVGALLTQSPIDVAFVGIGENGHLAFNDPPADFDTTEPYLVVELDEACRRQQAGEGWFATLDDVPEKAISMSVQQILKSHLIVCTVPDERKAQAVHDCLTGEITPQHPASILQNHPNCHFFFDEAAASKV